MYGQHNCGQRAEKQCANHQAEGGGHQFRRGVELAAGVAEGGSGHHADGQQADAADGDEVHAGAHQFRYPLAETHDNQAHGCGGIADVQRPQQRLFGRAFRPPAHGLNQSEQAAGDAAQCRQRQGEAQRHQSCHQHRQDQRRHQRPLRRGRLRRA